MQKNHGLPVVIPEWFAKMNSMPDDPPLSVPYGYETENAETAGKDPDSVLSWYRALADLRKKESVLSDGAFFELNEADPALYAFARWNGNTAMITAVNFTGSPVSFRLPEDTFLSQIFQCQQEGFLSCAPASR